MNTENNSRRKNTILKIQRAYMDLCISRSDINTITVSDICKKGGVNRTTFYSIYFDIADLKDAIEDYMMDEFLHTFFKEEVDNVTHSMNFTKLFTSIKENQIFYRLYFKMGFDFKKTFLENEPSEMWRQYFRDNADLPYHIEFFAGGITAMIKKWLSEGCPGEPERMGRILVEEYNKNNTF